MILLEVSPYYRMFMLKQCLNDSQRVGKVTADCFLCGATKIEYNLAADTRKETIGMKFQYKCQAVKYFHRYQIL